jgi:hypothetical protein
MGKEPAANDADEEPLFDDTKFAIEQLRSAVRKLEGVGEAFNIKAHHDVYKDPCVKGLTFKIHGLAENLEKPPCGQAGSSGDDGSHGDDSSHDGDEGDDGSHTGDDGGTPAN